MYGTLIVLFPVYEGRNVANVTAYPFGAVQMYNRDLNPETAAAGVRMYRECDDR